jgi:galactokinase
MIKKIIEENSDFITKTPDVYFSPGRVNVIGEHIDYHGGFVFPAAIELGIYAFVSKRTDGLFHVKSLQANHQAITIINPTDLAYEADRGWANFVSGMMDSLLKTPPKTGLNLLFYSTLPSGSGLSSSAALEVLVGVVLNHQYHLKIPRLDLVQIAQKVENNYINVNCGIMDQFAVGMGRSNHAIYLNTETLEYQLVPFNLKDNKLLIANTNKHRQLADSKYNERVNECKIALNIIQANYRQVSNLSELNRTDLNQIETILDNERLFRRVRHVITETDRTNRAVKLLTQGNLTEFGHLLNASHESLKTDYEVSCHELDTLVDAFLDEGAIGARMTGAGFGGCIVAIVPPSFKEEAFESIKQTYRKATHLETDIYTVRPTDGTKRITVKEME